MMFDLEVQEGHPPVNEAKRTGLYVHGMNRGVANPIYIHVVLRNHWQMGVGHCKVDEDVVGSLIIRRGGGNRE